MANNFLIKSAKVSSLKASLIQPFRTALGQHDKLENLLFAVTLEDGTTGWGEAAVASHITGETIVQTKRNLETAKPMVIGRPVWDYLNLSDELHKKFPQNKCAVAAIEMAVLDALTRQRGIPLWKLFGSKLTQLTTDITVVIDDLQKTQEVTKEFYSQGFRTFKVKIGRDEELDFQRVVAVHKLARKAKIILDANQGYNADQTLKFLKRLDAAGIQPILIEQPVVKKDWYGLKKVTCLSRVPVCADESVGSYEDALRAVREKAVHVINIKLMKTGLVESEAIAALAKKNGIKLMIGGMMESSLAMTAAAHLAVGIGGFDFIDLDTPFFIKNGWEDNPYLSKKGIYDLEKVPGGIGITANEHF